MIDLRNIHHIGIPVADIASTQRELTVAFGVDWAPVRLFDPLPFWTQEHGAHEVLVRATYSKEGPQRIELVQGTGAFFDPRRAPDARHVGVWADDLAAEARRLIALGWQVAGANLPPDQGYGVICYLAPPAGGLLVELISTAIADEIAAWIAG